MQIKLQQHKASHYQHEVRSEPWEHLLFEANLFFTSSKTALTFRIISMSILTLAQPNLLSPSSHHGTTNYRQAQKLPHQVSSLLPALSKMATLQQCLDYVAIQEQYLPLSKTALGYDQVFFFYSKCVQAVLSKCMGKSPTLFQNSSRDCMYRENHFNFHNTTLERMPIKLVSTLAVEVVGSEGTTLGRII